MGDRVSFQATSGKRKVGVIIRLNKKAASIATDDRQQWNVHPGFWPPPVLETARCAVEAMADNSAACNVER